MDWKDILERWGLWHQLRGAGNSWLVRLTLLTPVFGYLILLNEKITPYFRPDPQLSLSIAGGLPVRLLCFYYGTLFLAFASLAYAFRCPTVVKRHGDASAYFNSEGAFYTSVNHREVLHSRVESLLEQTYIPSLQPQVYEQSLEPLSHGMPVQDAMAIEWELSNRGRFISRILCVFLFSVGFLTLSVPSAITFAEVTIRLAAWLLIER